MKFLIVLTFVALSAISFSLSFGHYELCSGIMEDHDLEIPVGFNATAMDIDQFNDVLDRVERVYNPIIKDLGGHLVINRLWENPKVNASAERRGNRYVINMFGGLARYPAVTVDAFALVACHEIGHHLGGAPLKEGFWSPSWASNEGQSDYFAGTKCFRQIYTPEENLNWAIGQLVHPTITEKCTKAWSDGADQALCMRFATAGRSITQMFKEIKFPNETLDFDQPDTSVVSETFSGHPRPQCRLDTYFHSAMCDSDIRDPFDKSNPELGACTRSQGYDFGTRRLCWYKPI